ncbi:MAG: preprotein translocase subunit SecG [Caldisericaceae bacterium]
MTVKSVVLIVLDLVFAVGAIVSIVFMEPKGSGLGAISGGATVFHNRSLKDVLLDRLATIFSIAFLLTSIFLAVFKVF